MKVLGLLTLATSLALAMGHVLPVRNVIDKSGDNNATTSDNTTQVEDLGKFNGTWHVLSMEQDIYKEMQKVAKKYNATCTCPQLTLTPVGSVALDANASCTLQNNAQLLSHGLLTLLPQRRKAEYSFALLFSRFYIDSNDTNSNDTNHSGNLVPMDSGVKGNLFWSFYSSNNGSDDVAFVRSKHMISGDNKHDVPDVNMVLSTSQDANYNATAIPGLGKDHKWDYVKLDKCNSTFSGTQPNETSSGQPQPTEGGQPNETSNGQPQPTSSEGGQPTESGQQPTSDQPQSTETSSQPQPTETSNDGGQQQGDGSQQQGDGNQQQGDGGQQQGNGDQQQGNGDQQQGNGNQQGNDQQGNGDQQQGNGDQQQIQQ